MAGSKFAKFNKKKSAKVSFVILNKLFSISKMFFGKLGILQTKQSVIFPCKNITKTFLTAIKC